MKCPKCKGDMEKVKYDVGFGIVVDSLACPVCKFNITDEKILDEAMEKMRKKMAIRTKILRIGTGIGIRFPNEIVKNRNLRKGQEIEIIPKSDEIILKEDTEWGLHKRKAAKS